MEFKNENCLDIVLSGANTEMRGITAAEVLLNGGVVDITDLHETIYDIYHARQYVEANRRIHIAETRQQLRRMDSHGYYNLGTDTDLAEITEQGLISAGASGYLLEAGLDTGVSIMSVVGYTAFSDRSSNISATHQLIESVMQDPEKPLPLQHAVDQFKNKHGQYKLYYRMMRNLASSGVLNVTKKVVPGEFKGHSVVCMTGPDTSSKSGQLVLSFVEKYLSVADTAINDPESLVEGVDTLIDVHEEIVRSDMIGPLILRGLETAKRYRQKSFPLKQQP